MAGKKDIGIVINLDGDTQGLDAALKSVDKRSKALNSELREVENLLKFNPGNTDVLAQKQQLLAEQVSNTTKRLDALKQAQAEVEKGFKSGDIGAEQYRRFQRELVKTESQLDSLKQKQNQVDSFDINTSGLKSARKAVQGVESDLKGVAAEANEAEGAVGELGSALAGVAAGAGVGGIIDKALESSSIDTRLEMTLPTWSTDEYAASAKTAVRDLTAYGLDVAEATEAVRRFATLEGDTGNGVINDKTLKSIGAIATAYEAIDITELVQESREIAGALDITTDEAVAMTNALLKAKFPPDQLDIIAEYGSQLKRAGYDAEEIQAIMASAANTDSFNIDNLLDGLKEGRILATEFGQGLDKNTRALFDASGIGADRVEQLGAAVAAGGAEGRAAMSELTQSVLDLEDATLRNEVGVKIFGTMWEDQGENVAEALLGANDMLVSMDENTKQLKADVDTLNSDPFVQLQQALTDIMVALDPLLQFVAGVVSAIATWASENPKLASTLVAVSVVLGIIAGAVIALSPLIASIIALVTTTGIAFGALAAPIAIAVAAVVAIAGIAALLIANWSGVKDFFSGLFTGIVDGFNSLIERVASAGGVVGEYLNTLLSIATSVLDLLKNLFIGVFAFIVGVVAGDFDLMREGIMNTLGAIPTFVSDVVSSIVGFFEGIDLYEIGVNMLMGLARGIESMKNFVTETVAGVVDGAIGIAEALLDINSPSKVFEQIGRYTGEGLEAGIDAMGRRVSDASQNMVAGTVVDPNTNPSVTAKPATGSTSDRQAVININLGGVTVTSETDARSLSERIAKEVERAQRGIG